MVVKYTQLTADMPAGSAPEQRGQGTRLKANQPDPGAQAASQTQHTKSASQQRPGASSYRGGGKINETLAGAGIGEDARKMTHTLRLHNVPSLEKDTDVFYVYLMFPWR